jgi:putative transposase
MDILKAYRFKLEPTTEQEEFLSQSVGAARFLWNKALAMNLWRLENGYPLIWYSEFSKMLTLWKQSEEMSFLKVAPSQSLQQKLQDLERAFKDAFDKKQKNKRIPTFKKKGRCTDSIRFPSKVSIGGDHNVVNLPKIGGIKFRRTRRVKGEIRSATVSFESGQWFVSILCKVEHQPTSTATSAVGIDMGVVRFATITDGKNHSHIEPINSFRASEKKLAKAQRSLSRKVRFSNNWKKQKAKVAKIHSHIANQRKDFLHKHSTMLSKNHAAIVVEDLKVRNMSRSAKGTINEPGSNVKAKSGLNKSILDQGWSMFVGQLEYKLAWQQGTLIKVDPKNTSRCCPACGYTSAENRQTQAEFECVDCGFVENADVVGALNVLARGHRVIACGAIA